MKDKIKCYKNTMGKGGVNIPLVGVKIPWIGGSIYHGQGAQNTMGRGVKIPWVGSQNTMDGKSRLD